MYVSILATYLYRDLYILISQICDVHCVDVVDDAFDTEDLKVTVELKSAMLVHHDHWHYKIESQHHKVDEHLFVDPPHILSSSF